VPTRNRRVTESAAHQGQIAEAAHSSSVGCSCAVFDEVPHCVPPTFPVVARPRREDDKCECGHELSIPFCKRKRNRKEYKAWLRRYCHSYQCGYLRLELAAYGVDAAVCELGGTTNELICQLLINSFVGYRGDSIGLSGTRHCKYEECVALSQPGQPVFFFKSSGEICSVTWRRMTSVMPQLYPKPCRIR
jgi:hypothetical protein